MCHLRHGPDQKVGLSRSMPVPGSSRVIEPSLLLKVLERGEVWWGKGFGSGVFVSSVSFLPCLVFTLVLGGCLPVVKSGGTEVHSHR